MRSVPDSPIFAPHLLDVAAAAAAKEASSSEAIICKAAGTVAESCTPQMVPSLVAEKYCGKSVGEVAATCGISLAASVYLDPRRFQWMDEGTKRLLRKKLRLAMSHVLGRTVNFIADVENWWASQSFYKQPNAAKPSDL